jgi:ATP-binding cassette, subfamily B, bacterial
MVQESARPADPAPGQASLPATNVSFRRILGYFKPYRRQVALVMGSIALSALAAGLPPLFIKRIVDHAIPGGHTRELAWLCVGMVVGPLFAGLLGVAHKYLAAWIGEQVMYDLRLELFAHVQRQSLAFFANAKPGEVISRVLTDVQGIGQALQDNLVKLLQNALTLSVSVSLIFWLDWRLAVVALSALPLFVFPARKVGRQRKQLKKQTQARMAELTGILMETLSVSGVLLIKVFGARKRETRRLREKALEVQAASLRQNLVGRWFQMLMKLFEDLGPAAVYAVGGYLVITGELGLGTVLAFVTLLKKLYSPAADLAGVHVDVVTSYGYFERVLSVLDLEPAIKNAPHALALEDVKGALTFEDVSFAYAESEATLSNINLEIAPGESVAVVGPSGAGKSTLAALTLRLYDPTSGRILLDGHDYRDIKLKTLREHIAVVSQETYLFHASIADNLRYARPEASLDELKAAARAAQIDDFVSGLPQGYDTLVGERGYRLSGGERQRIAIARAILADPKILILDEATSALDSTNERLIQAALEPLLAGRTSLIIAHRLSTIQKANRIVSIDQGRIVEVGSHHALLERRGLYARLYEQQMSSGSAAAPPE